MITNTMTALMTAETTLKQAQVQQSAVKKDEGHAGILKAEIKNSLGDTSAKEAELKETEEHADELKAKQTDTLETANRDLRESIDRVREADREEAKKEAKEAEKKKFEKTGKEEKLGNAPETEEKGENDGGRTVEGTETVEVVLPDEAPDPFRVHKPIDIKA